MKSLSNRNIYSNKFKKNFKNNDYNLNNFFPDKSKKYDNDNNDISNKNNGRINNNMKSNLNKYDSFMKILANINELEDNYFKGNFSNLNQYKNVTLSKSYCILKNKNNKKKKLQNKIVCNLFSDVFNSSYIEKDEILRNYFNFTDICLIDNDNSFSENINGDNSLIPNYTKILNNKTKINSKKKSNRSENYLINDISMTDNKFNIKSTNKNKSDCKDSIYLNDEINFESFRNNKLFENNNFEIERDSMKDNSFYESNKILFSNQTQKEQIISFYSMNSKNVVNLNNNNNNTKTLAEVLVNNSFISNTSKKSNNNRLSKRTSIDDKNTKMDLNLLNISNSKYFTLENFKSESKLFYSFFRYFYKSF